MKPPSSRQHPTEYVRTAKKILAHFSVLAVAVTFFVAAPSLWGASEHAGGCPLHSRHGSHPVSHKCCQAGHQAAIALPSVNSRLITVQSVRSAEFTKPAVLQTHASAWLISDALPGLSSASAPLRI